MKWLLSFFKKNQFDIDRIVNMFINLGSFFTKKFRFYYYKIVRRMNFYVILG